MREFTETLKTRETTNGGGASNADLFEAAQAFPVGRQPLDANWEA